MNRSSIRYDCCGGAKAIRRSVNITQVAKRVQEENIWFSLNHLFLLCLCLRLGRLIRGQSIYYLFLSASLLKSRLNVRGCTEMLPNNSWLMVDNYWWRQFLSQCLDKMYTASLVCSVSHFIHALRIPQCNNTQKRVLKIIYSSMYNIATKHNLYKLK